MTEPCLDAHRASSKGDAVLVYVGLAWCLPAAAVSIVQLMTVGRLTPVVVSLDVIAAFLLPFAVMWLVLSYVYPAGDGPWGSDRADDRDWPPDDPEPGPPSGGSDFDWEQAEADFRAYTQSHEVFV